MEPARRSSQSPIAVDFGVSSMKVLQLGPGERPSLIAAAQVETPDDLRDDIYGRLEFQFEELGRIIRGGKFKGRRAVCAIPAGQTFCKHLQLGRATGAEQGAVLEQLLQGELGRDAASLVYRSYPVEGAVGPAAGRNEVVVMAACRGLVGKLMSGLRHAKLDPVGIHNEWSAQVRAFDRVNRREADDQRATLYLDVGQSGARVCVAHGQRLVFARSLEVGGRLFDEDYTARHGFEPATGRIERLRRAKPLEMRVPVAATASGAGGEGDRRSGGAAAGLSEAVQTRSFEVDAGLADTYGILADEIAMCVRYHESLFGARRLDHAVLFGGEMRDRVLCQRIAMSLRVPTQVTDPFSVISHGEGAVAEGVKLGDPQPGWVLALGLCESPTEL